MPDRIFVESEKFRSPVIGPINLLITNWHSKKTQSSRGHRPEFELDLKRSSGVLENAKYLSLIRLLRMGIYCYFRRPAKKRKGNVFIVVCLSVHRGIPHGNITHDALVLTVENPWSCPQTLPMGSPGPSPALTLDMEPLAPALPPNIRHGTTYQYPSPLLLISGDHYWRPVQICSLENPTPPILTSGGRSTYSGQTDGKPPTGVLSCLLQKWWQLLKTCNYCRVKTFTYNSLFIRCLLYLLVKPYMYRDVKSVK